MNSDLRARVSETLGRITHDLLNELSPDGHWAGELSSSALSTAVATIALGVVDRRQSSRTHQPCVEAGLRWLAAHANPDGGWGDTTRSPSNLSTTALGWAAFGSAQADLPHAGVVAAARDWLHRAAGSADRLVPAIEARYGDDRTFSVPIVLTLALAGRLGPHGWRQVRPLPFELAALPRGWFGALRLPVVSYALPALIALGQAIHQHAPSRNPIARSLRRLTASRTMSFLERVQPPNGGFLEATPLTAFVTMSLAVVDRPEPTVLRRGVEFLRASMRPDGSWPIDTNLATWVTTLAIKSLRHQPCGLDQKTRRALREWLIHQQYRVEHPYTGAAPGGWAWTDLPGGVPDADDTAGALLALHELDPTSPECLNAAIHGVNWLENLQNRNGGIPTFCRGWGRLPFDRSAPDLTAHAIQAWRAWTPFLPAETGHRLRRAIARAMQFLRVSQREDGAWIPLWFGHQSAPGQMNPVYGTAQVVTSLARGRDCPDSELTCCSRALDFLVRVQHDDGGWGGDRDSPSSVEETSLAITALVSGNNPPRLEAGRAAVRGVAWLLDRLQGGSAPEPAPIGLYFAKLWYAEKLYPWIFAADALGAFQERALEKGS